MRREMMEVVDAAKALGLKRTPRGVAASGTPREFATRLSDLLDALERFDRAGSAAAEPPEVRLQRGIDAVIAFAAAQGLDPESARAAAIDAMGPEPWDEAETVYEPPDLRPRPRPRARPGAPESDVPRADERPPVPAPGGRAAAEAAGRAVRRVGAAARDLRKAMAQLEAAMAANALHPDVADAALRSLEQIVDVYGPPRPGLEYDPDSFDSATRPDLDTDQYEPPAEDVSDFGAAIDAMADRLLYGVRRVGWSPRLRRLAVAWRKALNEAARVEFEMAAGVGAGAEFRIPEQRWRELQQALSDIARPARDIRPAPREEPAGPRPGMR